MKIKITRAIIWLLWGMFIALAAGCEPDGQRDNKTSWTRPASWEGGLPGMSSNMGTR